MIKNDNLKMRHANSEDIEALAIFNFVVHNNGVPNPRTGNFIRNLLNQPGLSTSVNNTVVIEDTNTGAIISSLIMLLYTWEYGGVAFEVGQVEYVGTLPAYRRRGLV